MSLFQGTGESAGNNGDSDGVKALIDDRWYSLDSDSE